MQLLYLLKLCSWLENDNDGLSHTCLELSVWKKNVANSPHCLTHRSATGVVFLVGAHIFMFVCLCTWVRMQVTGVAIAPWDPQIYTSSSTGRLRRRRFTPEAVIVTVCAAFEVRVCKYYSRAVFLVHTCDQFRKSCILLDLQKLPKNGSWLTNTSRFSGGSLNVSVYYFCFVFTSVKNLYM